MRPYPAVAAAVPWSNWISFVDCASWISTSAPRAATASGG